MEQLQNSLKVISILLFPLFIVLAVYYLVGKKTVNWLLKTIDNA